MLDALRRRQTLASFDYQWGELAAGDAMLSDAWFREHVAEILANDLLGLEPAWFQGRRVLDAGCGIGRWTLGLLRLGCDVTAVDASARALAALEQQMSALAPEAVAAGRLRTQRVDLLALPEALAAERFDLVFSFGVLHHTGDTHGALRQIAPLVVPAGVLFLYLYGSRSLDLPRRLALFGLRTLLSPLSFRGKAFVLQHLLPGRDTHQAFDTFSPLINDVYTHETVEGWLHALGFTEVARTLEYTELYLRARRPGGPPLPTRPSPRRPYWFERYRRRPLREGSAPPRA
jgi:SAM-dependent methyltransferase